MRNKMPKNEDGVQKFWEDLKKQQSFKWLLAMLVFFPFLVFVFYSDLRKYIWEILSIYVSFVLCILPFYVNLFKEIRKNNMDLERERQIRSEDKENSEKEQFKRARSFFSVNYRLFEPYEFDSEFITNEFDPEVFDSHCCNTKSPSEEVKDYYQNYRHYCLLINNYSSNPMLAVKVEIIMKDNEHKENAYVDIIKPASKIFIYSRKSEKDYLITHSRTKESIEPKKINVYFTSKLDEKVKYEYLLDEHYQVKGKRILKESEGNELSSVEYNPEELIESHTFSSYFRND